MANANKPTGPSRDWLTRAADIEDTCRSVSVGGLAADLGMLVLAQPGDELVASQERPNDRIDHEDVALDES